MSLRTDAAVAFALGTDTVREGSPGLGEQIACFLDDLTLAGRSPATVRTYRHFVRQIDKPNAAHTDGTQIATNASLAPDCTTTARQILLRYLGVLSSAKLAYASLCAFATWQVDQGYVSESFMARIPSPKGKERPPKQFLTVDQVRAIYAARPVQRA